MLVLDDLLLVGVTCWGDLLGTGPRLGGAKSHNRRLARGRAPPFIWDAKSAISKW
jgi:hypothetical protein